MGPRMNGQPDSSTQAAAVLMAPSTDRESASNVEAMRLEAQHAATELGSLRVIIASGVATLQDSFQNLAAQIDSTSVKAGPGPGRVAAIESERSEHGTVVSLSQASRLRSELDRALQAVQFDDMATQLIERVNQRLGRIESGLQSRTGQPVPPIHSAADRARAVDFRGQAHSGEVELF